MAFDPIRFFEQHGVAYRTRGPNISSGNMVIRCPWCGAEDSGEHLSVATNGRGFRCLRKPHEHSGGMPKLVQRLLGCSWQRAAEITGSAIHVPDDFSGAIHALLSPKKARVWDLVLPPEFLPLDLAKRRCRPFVNYLRARHFSDHAIERMHRRFGIVYCSGGHPYEQRVIFPIEMDGRLVSWTGRHIGTHPVRYRTLTVDPEKEANEGALALERASDCLLWYDDLLDADADTLVICEGPFDALKTDVLGYREGIVATCLFTMSASPAQLDRLSTLSARFKRRVLLLDAKGTFASATRIALSGAVSGLEVRTPIGAKDPGAIKSVDNLLRALA